MLKEFKAFISKGNVLDLAVGVIIGGAFGKIVASFVADIIMPLVGVIVGGINISDLSAVVGSATITYGIFIQTVVDFFIIALCIFLFIKLISSFKKEKPKEAAPPPEPSKEEQLLTQIRDLLKNKN
ncbi:MAG: large-conductance mechanosensitive channel protein MscL [Eubacteriales bacterium]|nr:large-conductance mechanosensitive channel protein MscL [Eubacteriales bacterium]